VNVIIINKRKLITIALVLCLVIALIIGSVAFVPQVVETVASNRLIPIYSVERQDKYISISFDAAWGNEDTQTLINILNKYNVKTTFFVVASWVDKYPESVKALSDAGNEVMNHSTSHPHMPKLSSQQMLNEIMTCDDKIQKITGVCPILFRPPYGDYNNTLIDTLSSVKHYCIQWDVDSLDWKDISASQIQKNVLSKVKSGSIVLFHNAAINTPKALPGIIATLQKQGYKIVPISQLIYKTNYTIDHTGKQHLNAATAES
jgi:polysaccharide deacetylase family sporulation protein PdaB